MAEIPFAYFAFLFAHPRLPNGFVDVIGPCHQVKRAFFISALTRSTGNSPSAKATGRSSSDHKQRFPDLFDLFDCFAQGKEAGWDQQSMGGRGGGAEDDPAVAGHLPVERRPRKSDTFPPKPMAERGRGVGTLSG